MAEHRTTAGTAGPGPERQSDLPQTGWGASWIRTGLVSLAILGLLAGQILSLNGGLLTYTLDDPYIHLALSERIARGFYGLNVGEPASPSSSILFPFLILPGAGTPLHLYVPFTLDVLATLGSLAVLLRLFGQAGLAAGRLGRAWSELLVLVLAVSLNLYGIVFTGMEHSIQVLAALAVAAGLIETLDRGRMPRWLPVAIALNPLIRFEGLGVAAAALVCLTLAGRWRTAVLTGLAIAAALTAYGLFMHRLGLPFFPGSVLTKSRVAQAGNAGGLWLVPLLLDNMAAALRHQPSAQLLAAGAGLAALRPALGLLIPHGIVSLPYREALVALFAALVAAAHLAGGHYGWFGRYEVYAAATVLATLVWLWRRELGALLAAATGKAATGGWPARLAAGVALAAVPAALPPAARHLVEVTWSTPAAAHNIYQQHYQMHRFLTEFYPAPSAVADLGYAAYGNPNYILDLRGLGSEPARLALRSGAPPEEWIRALSEPHGIEVALIYDVAFPRLPAGWTRLAYLHLKGPRITPADSVVTVYATRPEAIPRIQAQLARFQATLPPDTALEMASDGLYRPGDTVGFGETGTSHRYKREGWWTPEGEVTWTWAKEAVLDIPLAAAMPGGADLLVDAVPFLTPGHPSQEVEVLADGQPVAHWTLTGAGEQRAAIPAAILGAERPPERPPERPLRLTFRIARPLVPAELGLSTDDRPLGIALRSLRLVPRDGGYRPGERVSFTDAGTAYRYMRTGWWPAETTGTWTRGTVAELEIPLASAMPGGGDLAVEAAPFLAPGHPSQEVEVLADGQPVAHWTLTGAGEWRAILPAAALAAGRTLRLTFRIAKPLVPAELGLSSDDRALGISLRSLRIDSKNVAG